MRFDDAARVRALREYGVLDTPYEDAFDNLVKLTARLFGTPISLVGLVDEKRQWFKARVGLEASETPREWTFCDHAIRADSTMVVPDAKLDPRFAENPFVLGAPHIRFYCGVPLHTPEGYGLGTLCILDREPRQLSTQQVALLESIGKQVEIELEIRRRVSLLEQTLEKTVQNARSREMLATMIVHDMRSPLTVITMLASSVTPKDEQSAADLEALLSEAERLRRMLVDILDVCLHGVGGLHPRRRLFPIAPLATEVATRASRQELTPISSIRVADPEQLLLVDADPELIGRVLDNLVGNAMQHAQGKADVTLRFRLASRERVVCEVEDRGTAIPEAQRADIFEPLTQAPASAHRGYGLGLAFCRLAVEAHGGKIGVRTNPDGVGNTFFFDLAAG